MQRLVSLLYKSLQYGIVYEMEVKHSKECIPALVTKKEEILLAAAAEQERQQHEWIAKQQARAAAKQLEAPEEPKSTKRSRARQRARAKAKEEKRELAQLREERQ